MSDKSVNQVEHELKIWPEPFVDLLAGDKRYEVRRSDRPFAVGHTVWFREWNPTTKEYTGAEAFGTIIHLTPAGSWGLPADVCVFGIEIDEGATFNDEPSKDNIDIIDEESRA